MEYNIHTNIRDLLERGLISARTYKCIFLAGMDTLGDIVDNIEKPSDLMYIRNFGRKSCAEIEPILNQIIRKYYEVPKTKEEQFVALGETLVEIISDAYSKVTEGETNAKAYLKAAYPHPFDLHELVMEDEEKMLAVVEGYSPEENLEIRHSFKQFMELVLGRMECAQEAENAIYVEYKCKSMDLAIKMESFSYEQRAKCFLSSIAKEYLEEIYQENLDTELSARSKNFADKFVPHFEDLVKYAEEPLSSYRRICPGRTMAKTLSELFLLNQKFKKVFDRVSVLTDDEIKMETLKRDYPYLVASQREFVLDFMKEKNHVPLFFLMLNYLRLSENGSNKIYCLLHGIFDGKKRSLQEVADAMSLSRERIRQVLVGTIEIQKSTLAKHSGWDYYKSLFTRPVIFERTKEYVRLKQDEHLSIDFEAFASLLILVADFKVEDVEGHSILLNKDLGCFDFVDNLNALHDIMKAQYAIDTYVPLDSVLVNIPERIKSIMKGLFRFIAAQIYKVRVTREGQLFLPQNRIDVSRELYDILAQNGKPMHVDKIFAEFKRRHPGHKYSNSSQIRNFLYKHEHIKAIGKTSCFGLDSWEGVYFGSIRDLLVDLLSESDVPLHIDILYEGVSKHYPNTTKASVASTMEDENLKRFVAFEGGYFGLKAKSYSVAPPFT
ncbi:MAG: hypothetical protein J5616_02070 [Bacteroidaceae bacterium]|nr:hypothetical protein [Bacteroidaceae bacterium]